MAGIQDPAPLSRKRRHRRVLLVRRALQLCYRAGKADRDLLLRIAEIVYQQTFLHDAKAKFPPAPGKAQLIVAE